MKPESYANYILTKKAEQDEAPVRKKYEDWLFTAAPLTMDMLISKQYEVVIDALKNGIMDYDLKTNLNEKRLVDVEKIMMHLPEGYELPDDIDARIAKFRRHITWGDDCVMMRDYESSGRYICRQFDKFTNEQLIAIFEVEMMLYYIHQDMVRLNPELAKYLDKGENYFPIVKNISVLMKQDWFEDMRTNANYDHDWIDQFFENFMAEWGKMIAQEWQVADRRDKVKCMILGAVKDAGAIDGNYQTIADNMEIVTDKPKTTLAKYMGYGKKAPYFYWICDYVNG
jgi:hypothetical protein